MWRGANGPTMLPRYLWDHPDSYRPQGRPTTSHRYHYASLWLPPLEHEHHLDAVGGAHHQFGPSAACYLREKVLSAAHGTCAIARTAIGLRAGPQPCAERLIWLLSLLMGTVGGCESWCKGKGEYNELTAACMAGLSTSASVHGMREHGQAPRATDRATGSACCSRELSS